MWCLICYLHYTAHHMGRRTGLDVSPSIFSVLHSSTTASRYVRHRRLCPNKQASLGTAGHKQNKSYINYFHFYWVTNVPLVLWHWNHKWLGNMHGTSLHLFLCLCWSFSTIPLTLICPVLVCKLYISKCSAVSSSTFNNISSKHILILNIWGGSFSKELSSNQLKDVYDTRTLVLHWVSLFVYSYLPSPSVLLPTSHISGVIK